MDKEAQEAVNAAWRGLYGYRLRKAKVQRAWAIAKMKDQGCTHQDVVIAGHDEVIAYYKARLMELDES